MISSTHLQYLAKQASVILFSYDLARNQFTFMNPACQSFFELDRPEIDPNTLLGMISPDDRNFVLSKFKALIAEQLVENVEFRISHRGSERWLRLSPSLISENKEWLIVGHAEDITSAKANIEVLNNHNIKKNTILTILAHDLAGPIGTVQNLSTLLSNETSKLQNPRIDHLISLISKISKSNLHLIRNFIDQEFLESSSTVLFKKRVELVSKIHMATEEILNMREELKIEFVFNASQDQIYAEIDEDKFMQVIHNLITNSIKFTPDGGKIEVKLIDKNNEVLLSISDNGVGIPKQYHATLFDKFTDARRPGLKGEPSTGLGMSIIKKIVEWHDGIIWFESEENAGTTFYIKLPVQDM